MSQAKFGPCQLQRLMKVGVLGNRLSCCQKAHFNFDSSTIDMFGLLKLDACPLHIHTDSFMMAFSFHFLHFSSTTFGELTHGRMHIIFHLCLGFYGSI